MPKTFSDQSRREAVLRELQESRAETVVLLGDEPVKHWLAKLDGRWRSLADFGDTDDDYGRHARCDDRREKVRNSAPCSSAPGRRARVTFAEVASEA